MHIKDYINLIRKEPARILYIFLLDLGFLIAFITFNMVAFGIYPLLPGMGSSGFLFVVSLIFYMILWYELNVFIHSFIHYFVLRQLALIEGRKERRDFLNFFKHNSLAFSVTFIEIVSLIMLLGFNKALQGNQSLAFVVIFLALLLIVMTMIVSYYFISLLHNQQKSVKHALAKLFNLTYYGKIILKNIASMIFVALVYVTLNLVFPEGLMFDIIELTITSLAFYLSVTLFNRLAFMKLEKKDYISKL